MDPLQILRDLVSDEFECAICLHTCSDTNINPQCGHRFCKVCIKESLTSCSHECPICRARIPTYRTLRQDAQYDRILLKILEIIAVLEANRIENEMSATNSSKESCGKKTKCAVSSNRHDMDSSVGGKREAASGGMVAEENHQLVNAKKLKDKSSATKKKPRLNYHSNIIIRKRKVSVYSTLSTQEKASKSKRKKERCQAEDEMANKDAKQNEWKKRKTSDYHLAVPAGIDISDLIHHEANMDEGTDMHTTNANDINANANANARDAHANVQLPIYQSARATSEAQKSQVVAENQILRQSCAQARIIINDVISPVQVATGEEKVAADLTNDITEAETEALATIESHSLHARQVHPHAHAHHQVHSPHNDAQHHHAHHASMTPNTAGLPSRLEEKWESRFRDLAAYKEQHGNCIVPRNSSFLGIWVSYQKTLFRSKELKENRYEKLVGIGFVFENAKVAINNVRWNTLFVELKKYKEKNGHCSCPTTNGSLGYWVKEQRRLFRFKKLKADRYEKLVEIGFEFENAKIAMANEKWNRLFVELVEYKGKNGHCNFPSRNGGSLGSWVKTQRSLFRSKELKEDRYEKLLGIEFA